MSTTVETTTSVGSESRGQKAKQDDRKRRPDGFQQFENDYVRSTYVLYTFHYLLICAIAGLCLIPPIQKFISDQKWTIGIASFLSVLFCSIPLLLLLHFIQTLRTSVVVNYVLYLIFIIPQGFFAGFISGGYRVSYMLILYGSAAIGSFLIVILSRTKLSMASVRLRYSIVGLEIVFVLVGLAGIGLIVKQNWGSYNDSWYSDLVERAAMMLSVFLGVSLVVGSFITSNDLLNDCDEAIVQSDFLFAITLFYFTLLVMPWYAIHKIWTCGEKPKPKEKPKLKKEPSSMSEHGSVYGYVYGSKHLSQNKDETSL